MFVSGRLRTVVVEPALFFLAPALMQADLTRDDTLGPFTRR